MPRFDPAHPVLDLTESSTVLTQQICDDFRRFADAWALLDPRTCQSCNFIRSKQLGTARLVYD